MYCGPFCPGSSSIIQRPDPWLGACVLPLPLTQSPAAGSGATSCLYIFLWGLASPARISSRLLALDYAGSDSYRIWQPDL